MPLASPGPYYSWKHITHELMNMFQQIQSLYVSSHISYYISKQGPTFSMIVMYWVGRQMMQVWNKASTDNWSQGSLYRLLISNRKINCNHQWPPLSLLDSWIQPGTVAITQCSKVGSWVIRDSFKTLLNLLFSVIMMAGHVSYTYNFRLTLCCKWDLHSSGILHSVDW